MIEPLGGVKPVPVDVRVIAATNKDLHEEVLNGRFREDLYYRVRVVHLHLPGLAERREDIPLLIDHLLARFNRLYEKDIAGVDSRAMARLMEHDYPGNVRELENIIEQAFVLCRGGMIDISHLPPEVRPDAHPQQPLDLESIEKRAITEALQCHDGNRKRTAEELGIDVSTLYRKIKALAITPPSSDGRGKRTQSRNLHERENE